MFRTSDIILITVMLSAAAFTYKTKHDAEAMLGRVRALETQIQLEKDTIDVLKADWSLLTQPARLQRLVRAYEEELGLQVVEPQQIVEAGVLATIPYPAKTLEELIAESERMFLEGTDPTVTGGVQQ